MRLLPGMVMLMLALVISGSARATTDVMPFKDEAQEQQFRQLTEQLRCPKCQNNSIADSNAMIATDMRRRVYDLMQEGRAARNHRLHGGALRQLRHLRPAADPADGAAVGAAAGRHRGGRVDNRRPDAPAGAPAPGAAAGGHPVCGARAGGAFTCRGRHCAGGRRRQLRPDRQLSAGEGRQQATAQTPGLLARALDPQAQPLNEEEMARLALGLRTRLQNDAGNVEGWLMLGRTGMVLGNAGTATGAYANAYRLDPENRDAALGYAEALTRSSDPEDNRRGGELLRQLVSRDHTDIRVLSLYAFSAFEQQRFGEAVAAREMMLKLLPAGDARRAVIERSIRLAQEK